ncbi:hypothetical protein B5F40_01820 [Gordonibacter sp. An230]|uniref:phage holin n=1 Tax=Gordonibacter sp. An230 TaxID=1965592 RepID=UPI000B386BC9|nr:phage holin [Gordonibacter sp. An230]OUO92097.1 hypothetical protein B5F40_01820 [Gordonibacter sp. An230]
MNENLPSWPIPSRVYDVLKWAGLIALPALATLFGTCAGAWGADAATAQAVVTTINAVGTFIGVAIGASQLKAGKGGSDADEG